MSSMEHIKPGDQVIVANYFTSTLATVERVTKTQIITINGGRYRRSDGFAVGGGAHIRDATDEDRTRITYREATQRAEAALDTRSLSGLEQNQVQTYEARLLEAKAIIDAALDAGEATA